VKRLPYVLALCLILSSTSKMRASAEPEPKSIANQLMAGVPADFPRFTFEGHGEQADLLNHYMWYHFHHRGGNGVTLFNKEYLLTSDIWLGNARPRQSKETIQQVHRRNLLAVRMDDEGYVQTHQHFSHAHDHGWPFPMWTQAEIGPDRVKGKTAGWHFQKDLEAVPGWVGQHYLRHWKRPEYVGQKAAESFELFNAKSLGIKDNAWHIETTGPAPAVITPKGATIEAFQAPYLQLRWIRTGIPKDRAIPYVEWMREDDADFGPDRHVYFFLDRTHLSGRFDHSIITMYRHPAWRGKIKRIRISLAPGRSDGKFEIDSFFTAYDTRHTINNPIFILASARYFAWTQDLDFLRRQINRMRLALRYQQTVMGGLKHNHIRNPWPGHDGIAGYTKDKDGKRTIHGGHGIGNNYWDLMPFGHDDLYATNQYYAATTAMAGLEEAIERHPEWSMPGGALRQEPAFLRSHAEKVKATANELFWNGKTGRFIASIDKNGKRYDYGYTFLNLDAIWYDLADDSRSKDIMDWIAGKRIVKGDTSGGEDIYHWRFGPRATTVRNIEWYGQGWHHPEDLAWGAQVQDGGAVLGFSFYDLWARLKVLGPDDAWQRLTEILQWEEDVHSEGGYRKYYEGGKRGTTLQGGGTAGGLGIDHEFYESSLVPSILVYGFFGIEAEPGNVLSINPRLPAACPGMKVTNLLYKNILLDVLVGQRGIELVVKDAPADQLNIRITGFRPGTPGIGRGPQYTIGKPGKYRFRKQD